ncbi:uncharacterized protein LOC108994679 [Juglans regia]|uniref:Uncharacterized protein LOC108994679 n=2 Tax=Juglans regia TaxID=51240 RepID=A0A2I4F1L7_JUGRE|nr:uncharacterized protein LOC108994679 [Juglans regia]
MEIPVISCLNELELSIPNSSLFARILSVSGFEASSIWKVGALILAIVASFSTIANGINVFILKIKRDNSIASEPLLKFVGDYDTDSEGETCSSLSSSLEDDGEEDEDDEEPESHRCQPVDEDFRVAGGSDHYVESYEENRKSKFRRRFSWADFAGGRSVVKLWDNLGLGLDFNDDGDDSAESVISVYDTNKETRISSVFGGKPVAASTSPSLIVMASRENGSRDGLSLRLWDTRVRCRIPAMLGQWRPQLGKIVRVGYGGVEKVYFRDDATGDLKVGEVKKVSSPLGNGSDMDTWWDADTVIRHDVFYDE